MLQTVITGLSSPNCMRLCSHRPRILICVNVFKSPYNHTASSTYYHVSKWHGIACLSIKRRNKAVYLRNCNVHRISFLLWQLWLKMHIKFEKLPILKVKNQEAELDMGMLVALPTQYSQPCVVIERESTSWFVKGIIHPMTCLCSDRRGGGTLPNDSQLRRWKGAGHQHYSPASLLR